MNRDEIKNILKGYKEEIDRLENLLNNMYTYQSEYMNLVQSEPRTEKFKFGRVKIISEMTETYEKLVSSKNNILKEVYKIITEYKDDKEIRDFWLEISNQVVNQ